MSRIGAEVETRNIVFVFVHKMDWKTSSIAVLVGLAAVANGRKVGQINLSGHSRKRSLHYFVRTPRYMDFRSPCLLDWNPRYHDGKRAFVAVMHVLMMQSHRGTPIEAA